MEVLITTSFSILILNTNTYKLTHLHRGDGLYYGIARNEVNTYVAARKRMVSSNIPLKDEQGEIIVFDHNFKLKKRIQAPFPLRDLHQITWYDGKLWMTCPYDNMVAIWNGVDWQQWFPLSVATDDAHDAHHYNSFMIEEDIIWLLAHNHGPSELIAFSIHDKSLLQKVTLGTQAHNIWREKGQLYTCSSGNGQILGDMGFSLKLGGFPRGYACDGKCRYVGMSELAERKVRDLTTGKILIFDLEWNLIKTILLYNEGLVLDILSL